MRGAHPRLRRAWRILSGAAAAAFGAVLASLAFPQPAFAHHVVLGRLSLHSDRPFAADAGRAVLADVEARLRSSPLDDRAAYGIFIANDEPLRAVVFNLSGGAAGINYAPLTRNVFLRRSDVEGDRVYGASGRPAAPPRTLAYYAAHEIAHSFTAERLGPARLWNQRLPQWVREGYADYVGMGGRVDVRGLHARRRAGDPELSFARSHTYAEFRLLAAYFLQRRGWSADQLLASRLGVGEAEALMDADLGV